LKIGVPAEPEAVILFQRWELQTEAGMLRPRGIVLGVKQEGAEEMNAAAKPFQEYLKRDL